MSEITILIVEDDFSYALEVEMIIHELGYQLMACVNNSEKAIELVEGQKPDLILIDIFIEGQKDGIELAQAISSYNIPIIFITSHNSPHVYKRTRGLSPFAFITKPFDKYTLQSTIESAVNLLGQNSEEQEDAPIQKDHFFIKQNNQLNKVLLEDIQWIEADGNYCIIHTNGRRYAVKVSLRKLMKKLPADKFMQIHRRQIIQLSLVQNLDLSEMTVSLSDTKLDLGPKFKNQLLERLNRL